VEDATGFNLWSLFVAVVGSAVVLMLHHAFTRDRIRLHDEHGVTASRDLMIGLMWPPAMTGREGPPSATDCGEHR
jgi:hypothetical protein